MLYLEQVAIHLGYTSRHGIRRVIPVSVVRRVRRVIPVSTVRRVIPVSVVRRVRRVIPVSTVRRVILIPVSTVWSKHGNQPDQTSQLRLHGGCLRRVYQ